MLPQAKTAEPVGGLLWLTAVQDPEQVLRDRPTAAGFSPTQWWAVSSRTMVAPALGGLCLAWVAHSGHVDRQPPHTLWSDPLMSSFSG